MTTAQRTSAPAPATSDAPEIRPLLDAWELSLDSAGKSAKTINVYLEGADQLATFLEDAGMPTVVKYITREHLEAWLVSLRRKGRSPATVSNRYRAIAQLFKWLAEVGEIAKPGPMEHMTPPKVTPPRIEVLSPDEMNRLIKNCSGATFDDRRDLAILLLFADTGLRRTELTHLRLGDVNVKEKFAIVTRKGGREEKVPFGRKAATAISNYINLSNGRRSHPKAAETDRLWIGQLGALTDSGIAQVVRRRGNEAKIKGLHPHQLRHSYAHNWLAGGGSEGDLMRNGGWRSRAMLDRYGASAAGERAREAHKTFSPMDRMS